MPRLIPTARRQSRTTASTTLTDPRRTARRRGLHPGPQAVRRRRRAAAPQGWQAEVLEGGTLAWEAAGLPMCPAPCPAPDTPLGHPPPPEDRPHRLPLADPPLRRPRPRASCSSPRPRSPAWPTASAPSPSTSKACPSATGATTAALTRCWTTSACTPRRWTAWPPSIRAADTDRHDLAPQAAGLLALSVGLSRMFRDDLQQLDAGIALYDALYRWARDGHRRRPRLARRARVQ